MGYMLITIQLLLRISQPESPLETVTFIILSPLIRRVFGLLRALVFCFPSVMATKRIITLCMTPLGAVSVRALEPQTLQFTTTRFITAVASALAQPPASK